MGTKERVEILRNMISEGKVSTVAYFRTDGGRSTLYTQEYVNEKDNAINELLKRVSDLEFEVEKLEKNVQYKYINGQAYFRQDYVLGREKEIGKLEEEYDNMVHEYDFLISNIRDYLNCYQYFLETQEENNKKIANMIHEFSLGSDKE